MSHQKCSWENVQEEHLVERTILWPNVYHHCYQESSCVCWKEQDCFSQQLNFSFERMLLHCRLSSINGDHVQNRNVHGCLLLKTKTSLEAGSRSRFTYWSTAYFSEGDPGSICLEITKLIRHALRMIPWYNMQSSCSMVSFQQRMPFLKRTMSASFGFTVLVFVWLVCKPQW